MSGRILCTIYILFQKRHFHSAAPWEDVKKQQFDGIITDWNCSGCCTNLWNGFSNLSSVSYQVSEHYLLILDVVIIWRTKHIPKDATFVIQLWFPGLHQYRPTRNYIVKVLLGSEFTALPKSVTFVPRIPVCHVAGWTLFIDWRFSTTVYAMLLAESCVKWDVIDFLGTYICYLMG